MKQRICIACVPGLYIFKETEPVCGDSGHFVLGVAVVYWERSHRHGPSSLSYADFNLGL